MIRYYVQKDLEAAIDAYIRNREHAGLSRDTSKFGALKEIEEKAKLRKAVEEDTGLKILDDMHKRQTDKLSPI